MAGATAFPASPREELCSSSAVVSFPAEVHSPVGPDLVSAGSGENGALAWGGLELKCERSVGGPRRVLSSERWRRTPQRGGRGQSRSRAARAVSPAHSAHPERDPRKRTWSWGLSTGGWRPAGRTGHLYPVQMRVPGIGAAQSGVRKAEATRARSRDRHSEQGWDLNFIFNNLVEI